MHDFQLIAGDSGILQRSIPQGYLDIVNHEPDLGVLTRGSFACPDELLNSSNPEQVEVSGILVQFNRYPSTLTLLCLLLCLVLNTATHLFLFGKSYMDLYFCQRNIDAGNLFTWRSIGNVDLKSATKSRRGHWRRHR